MTGSRRAYLGIGSNLGDRLSYLQLAVDHLVAEDDMTVVAVSPVYETVPVGGPDQPDYLNAVVAVDTTLTARELLGVAQGIEVAAERVRTVRWGPRTLDVDVLDAGGIRLDTPELTLPHPRAAERAFVLAPWLDVAPEAVIAGAGRVADLLARVRESDPHGVRPTGLVLHR